MWTVKFWKDAGERAAKTFAQGIMLNIVVGDAGPANLFRTNVLNLLAFGATAAILSVLTSMASSTVNDPTSASLVEKP